MNTAAQQTEQKHTPTPGPWFAYPTTNERMWDVHFGDRQYAPAIAACHFNEFVDGMELAHVEANARLMAAAPDMLAALKAWVDEVGGTFPFFSLEPTLAAIAKAEGR